MKQGVVIALFLLLMPLGAAAKSTRETTYRYSQIWNTTVRFLRVDNGFPITEKDRKSGYLMFGYKGTGQPQIGSVELVETVRENRRFITVGLRVDNMPSYIEVMLLDKLERKLRDEYGDPPAAVPLMAHRGRDDEREAARESEAAEEGASEAADPGGAGGPEDAE